MAALVRTILRGRFPAALISAAGFLLAALLLGAGGVTALFGAVLLMGVGAPAVVVAWYVGPRGAAEVGAIGAGLLALGSLQWTLPVVWLLGLYLPLAGAVCLLRDRPRFPWVGLGLGFLVVLGLGAWVVGTTAVLGDPQAVVHRSLDQAVSDLVREQELSSQATRQTMDQLQPAVPLLAGIFPGMVGAAVLGMWAINLVAGLYLASLEGGVPDWKSALRSFRLPEATVWLAIALGMVAWLGGGTPAGYWGVCSLVVIAVLFLAQGLAVIHSARFAYGLARGWLVVFYALFALFYQLGLAVALLGFADVWADFRERIGAA